MFKPKKHWIQRSIDTVTEEDVREENAEQANQSNLEEVSEQSNVQNSFDTELNNIEQELFEFRALLAEKRNQIERQNEAQRAVNQTVTQAQVHCNPIVRYYPSDFRLQEESTTANANVNANDQDHLNVDSIGAAPNQNQIQQEAGPENHTVNEHTDRYVTPEDHEAADELVEVQAPDELEVQDADPGQAQPLQNQDEQNRNQNRQKKKTTVECEFCSAQLKNRFSLAKHKRLQHSKDGKLRSKKKKCNMCNTFKTKNNIHKHMKVCGRIMERRRLQQLDRDCAICDITFKNKRSKDNHVSKFHAKAKTKCSDCDEEVTYSYMSQHKERDCRNRPDDDDDEEEEEENED